MKRTETAIFREILSLCSKGPAGKTKIVYGANLNFKIANDYLGTLLKLKAIEQDGTKYTITEKGIVLCHQISALPAVLGGNA